MAKNKMITVIIPVYNVERFLPQCLDSVLSQSFRDFEALLILDGPTDGSGKICEEYALKDERIRIIRKENGGVSSARNAGIREARGKYLFFLDSDDYCAPKMLEVLLKNALDNKADISCCNYYFDEEDGLRTLPLFPDGSKFKELSSREALENGFSQLGFFAWNKIFIRRIFDGIKFPEGQLYEDISAVSKAFLAADKIVACDEPLYYYNRKNLQSITKKGFSVKKLDYFKASGEILAEAQEIKDFRLVKLIRRERAYHITGFCRQMAVGGFNDKAIIEPLIKELRGNIILHLTSGRKLSNKLFACALCVSWNLAFAIYSKLFGKYGI